MVALMLKADIALCRRCCGNPFLGEVLAGCVECLQLGRNEHTSPRDVVCATLDVEVGGIVSQPQPRVLPGTGVCWDIPAMAWNWGMLRLLVSWETSSKASQWVDSTALKGDARTQPLLALPTGSLIHLCAPCLPPVSSALVASQNWAQAGQDSHM